MRTDKAYERPTCRYDRTGHVEPRVQIAQGNDTKESGPYHKAKRKPPQGWSNGSVLHDDGIPCVSSEGSVPCEEAYKQGQSLCPQQETDVIWLLRDNGKEDVRHEVDEISRCYAIQKSQQ